MYTIHPSFTLGKPMSNSSSSLYSLLTSQQDDKPTILNNWKLVNPSHLDKKIKLDLDSSITGSDDDQTLPNFKQFELEIGKSTSPSSSTSSSPSHEPSFPSKDFRFTAAGSPYSSYPSSPIDNLSGSNKSLMEKKQVQQWVQELQSLRKRESQLLENLKNFSSLSSSSPSPYQQSDDSDEECYSPSFNHASGSINSSSVGLYVPSSTSSIPSPSSSLYNLINTSGSSNVSTPNQSQEVMIIQQQPPETIVFNRYINPSPIILIDQETISKCTGYLIVNASLVYRNSNISKSSSNQIKVSSKTEVLQGVKSIIVEKSGVVLFNKLKVNDNGFKYQNQSFSLFFTLSEISSDNQIHTISQITSSSFQFSTRSNIKRKFDEIDSDSQEPSSPQIKNSPICSSPYSPPSPMINTNSSESPNTTPSNLTSSSSSSSPLTSISPTPSSTNMKEDSNYIDITELLVLPQKEAAARLGISESMLCKRFKECTKRKWPYRYLKKIDKVIKILSFQNANEMPKEEKEKLERFTIEREECLRPVKIRITGCLEKEDLDLHGNHFSNSNSNSLNKSQIQNIISTPNDDMMNKQQPIPRGNPKLFEAFANGGESNGLENILETLEMLKHNTH